MTEQHLAPESIPKDLTTKQADFLNQGGDLENGNNYARLDEALRQINVTPSGHRGRGPAQRELEVVFNAWAQNGGTPEEFGIICTWIAKNPWQSDDIEESTYITTPRGRRIYHGPLAFR